MEMQSFDDGILAEIYVPEGTKVAVGQRIAMVLAPGEKPPAPGSEPAPAAAAAPKAQPATAAAPAPAARRAEPEPAAAAASGNGGTRVKASPLARKVAAERGIDLSRLAGSGPGGRIIQRDVLGAQPGGTPTAARPAAAPAPAPAIALGEGDQRIPLSGMRRAIAERLLASKTQIPHFYLNIEVDAGELMRIRAEINADAEKTGKGKLTVNDFILKAATTAAVTVPKVNASFAGDSIVQYANVNLAVAVAVEEGLVTPVVREAQKKSLREISEIVKDLAARARDEKTEARGVPGRDDHGFKPGQLRN